MSTPSDLSSCWRQNTPAKHHPRWLPAKPFQTYVRHVLSSERFLEAARLARAQIPVKPTWPGQDKFKGEIIHSMQYKGAEPFKGKRVVCVGAGESGSDITFMISEQAAKVCQPSLPCEPNPKTLCNCLA